MMLTVEILKKFVSCYILKVVLSLTWLCEGTWHQKASIVSITGLHMEKVTLVYHNEIISWSKQ